MGEAPGMTGADARVLLHNWPGVGGLEAWIAGRRWKAASGAFIGIKECSILLPRFKND
jgi:hypothetical protein